MVVCVNFGCGTSSSKGWLNYDSSPVLFMQRLPLVSTFAKYLLSPRYDSNIQYGNILNGLNMPPSSVDFVYSSHVIEHLTFSQSLICFRQVFKMLKSGGVFRAVMPDLLTSINTYINSSSDTPSVDFMKETLLGQSTTPSSARQYLSNIFSSPSHKWLWDYKSVSHYLHSVGFSSIRPASFNDSVYSDIFSTVESPSRWHSCLGFECQK